MSAQIHIRRYKPLECSISIDTESRESLLEVVALIKHYVPRSKRRFSPGERRWFCLPAAKYVGRFVSAALDAGHIVLLDETLIERGIGRHLSSKEVPHADHAR
jgi:hypothetical protein